MASVWPTVELNKYLLLQESKLCTVRQSIVVIEATARQTWGRAVENESAAPVCVESPRPGQGRRRAKQTTDYREEDHITMVT